MISYYTIEDQRIRTQSSEADSTLWYHATNPTDKEISQLTSQFQMPKDYITSILDDFENSRTEEFSQESLKRPALMLLQYPLPKTSPSGYQQINTFPFSIVVTPQKKIITIVNHEPPFLKKVFDHAFEKNDVSEAMNIFFQLMWQMTLAYNFYLKDLQKQCDRLEGQLQVSTENNQLYQLMDIQKSLVYFQEATSSNLKALSSIEKNIWFSNNHGLKNHLRDIVVETEQAMTSSRIQLRLVDQMNQAFSAIVSNNLNNVMKILTSLTVVLTIPTIIGGLYGMNIKLPFADRSDAFFWISLITFAICYVCIRYLRKKRLL